MEKSIKIDSIKPSDNNPRTIKDAKFIKLCASIKAFPEMMAARPIIIDETRTILGGNMRFRAIKKLKFKTIPKEWVKQLSGLSEEQKKEFTIKDNVGYGDWDLDFLAQWNLEELSDWGLDFPIWMNERKASEINSQEEWMGLPEFAAQKDSLKIVVSFRSEKDREKFAKKWEIPIMKKEAKTWITWCPPKEIDDTVSLKFQK